MTDKKKQHRILLIVLVSVLVLIGILYGGAAYYFSSHFYPGTRINGQNFSLSNVAGAEEKIRSDAEDYMLAVHDREDRVTYITGVQIAYQYESDSSIENFMKGQNAVLWPLHIGGEHDYVMDVKMGYDEVKLIALVEAMDCFKPENVVEPQDAYLQMTDNGYEIVPEEQGSQPLEEQILIDIREAIALKNTVLYLNDDDYVKPNITANDPKLTEKLAVSEKYRSMSITYEIQGYEQILEGSTILSWLTIDDDLSVHVNPDMAASYAQQLASKYNTYADRRSFKTTLGDTIEIGGGDYGWIVDKKAEAAQIIADIEEGESVTRRPCYEQTAFVEGTDDIGSTYIELDYTQQHLWYYKDGALVLDSDIVSGNISKGNGSPDGVFKVISRQKDVTLVGEDYESPVTYFMPFAYNVGFHDATWRTVFGGTYYKSDGSHGCINMPSDKAAELYNTVESGTPVIAYYRDDVKLTSKSAQISNAYSYSSN